MIFPNSVPSQFVGEAERRKKFKTLKNRQQDAADKLLYILPNYLAKLNSLDDVPSDHKEKIRELKNLLKQDRFLPTDLLEFRKIFN